MQRYEKMRVLGQVGFYTTHRARKLCPTRPRVVILAGQVVHMKSHLAHLEKEYFCFTFMPIK